MKNLYVVWIVVYCGDFSTFVRHLVLAESYEEAERTALLAECHDMETEIALGDKVAHDVDVGAKYEIFNTKLVEKQDESVILKYF